MFATGLIIHCVYDFKMFVIGHLACHLDSNLKELLVSNACSFYSMKGFLMLFHGILGSLSATSPLVRQGVVSTWEEEKAVLTGCLAVSCDSCVGG